MRRLLSAIVIALLVAAWAAAAAYGYLRVRRAEELAQGVDRGTRSFQHELDNPRLELLAGDGFPANCIAGAVTAAWSEQLKAGSYPPDVLAPEASAATRGRR